MKQHIILVCIIMASYACVAQNPPVVEKAAPKSNVTLPSNGTLGSNSGVNPAGNPGTIISYSGNSNSINTQVAPNPNIEPGVFLNSSPQGTVLINPNTDNTLPQTATTITQNGGTATAVVNPPATAPVIEAKPAPVVVVKEEPKTVVKPVVKVKTPEVKVVKNPAITQVYAPVLSNYVPATVIKHINDRYGKTVYDIKAVKIPANNKKAYLVRLIEDGKFREEIFYDE